MTYYTFIDSPLGEILLVSNGTALIGLHFVGGRHYPHLNANWCVAAQAEPFAATQQALRAYFAGERSSFAIPLLPTGTPYQQEVWRAIAEVPFGKTISYGELTARIGNPKGARAAGAATGRNPLSIFIPCHRILGARGALTGYAGGIDRKQALLRFEEAVTLTGPQIFPNLRSHDSRESV